MKFAWKPVSSLGLIAAVAATWTLPASAQKLLPLKDKIYHSSFADQPEAAPAYVLTNRVQAFEKLAKKKTAWSIVGNHWNQGIVFPALKAKGIADAGSLPFIVMMPWTTTERGLGADPILSMDGIINGRYDNSLRAWARDAKKFQKPILVSFAPESNGSWFPWSGVYNGADATTGYGNPNLADGPERYRDAYRHVVDLFAAEKVKNVTWFFQLVNANVPGDAWNKMAAYYPGDKYVDWLGVSVYSAQETGDTWEDFSETMDIAYAELEGITKTKPLAILEWGIIEDSNVTYRKADWIIDAFASLSDGRYPRVKAMTYWHESPWSFDGLNNMRIDSSPYSLRAYQQEVAAPLFTADTVFTELPVPVTSDKCKCGVFTNRFGKGCSVKNPENGAGLGTGNFLVQSGSAQGCDTEQQCNSRWGREYLNNPTWCPNGWVFEK